jgi:hypothetical protein
VLVGISDDTARQFFPLRREIAEPDLGVLPQPER